MELTVTSWYCENRDIIGNHRSYYILCQSASPTQTWRETCCDSSISYFSKQFHFGWRLFSVPSLSWFHKWPCLVYKRWKTYIKMFIVYVAGKYLITIRACWLMSNMMDTINILRKELEKRNAECKVRWIFFFNFYFVYIYAVIGIG